MRRHSHVLQRRDEDVAQANDLIAEGKPCCIWRTCVSERSRGALSGFLFRLPRHAHLKFNYLLKGPERGNVSATPAIPGLCTPSRGTRACARNVRKLERVKK